MEIRRAQLGEVHPATLASLNQLGTLYSNWGRYEEGGPFLVRAFDLRQRILGEEHPETLESMANLGWHYMCGARFEEGMTLAAKALDIGRRVLNEEDPIRLRIVTVLSAGYVTVMRYADAQPWPARVMRSAAVLGEQQETTLSLANLLAWAEEGLGHWDRATELAVRVVEIGRKPWGRGI